MRGRWSLLTAVVRGRRVRRSGREQLQAGTSALLYPSRGWALVCVWEIVGWFALFKAIPMATHQGFRHGPNERSEAGVCGIRAFLCQNGVGHEHLGHTGFVFWELCFLMFVCFVAMDEV